MNKITEHTLTIGGSARLRKRWVYKRELIYAGMPNDDVCSLVVMISEAHNSWAYNLFIPKGQREVTVEGARVTVLAQSREEIRIRIER